MLFFSFTGYYDDDGWFKPTPALQRAVHDTVSLLEGCGHTMVEFEPPNVPEAFKLFIGALLVDGGTYLLDKFNKVYRYFFRELNHFTITPSQLLFPIRCSHITEM